MLAIKLRGVGKKHQRTFRMVVQRGRSKLGGKAIEDLGWYSPHSNAWELKRDRALYWLGVGAKPTDTVRDIFRKSKIDINSRSAQASSN